MWGGFFLRFDLIGYGVDLAVVLYVRSFIHSLSSCLFECMYLQRWQRKYEFSGSHLIFAIVSHLIVPFINASTPPLLVHSHS